MAKYIASEEHWLEDFSSAWKLATTNGQAGLRYLDQTKEDPEPIIDACSALTKMGSCKRDSDDMCMWKNDARTVTNMKGETRKRGGCVPFSGDL